MAKTKDKVWGRGDVVKLKSGGPKMSVMAVDSTRSARCQWFDEYGDLHDGTFATESLKRAKG